MIYLVDQDHNGNEEEGKDVCKGAEAESEQVSRYSLKDNFGSSSQKESTVDSKHESYKYNKV